MKSHTPSSITGRQSGSMLLELVIALSMFAIAVLGLAKCLNGSLEISNILNKDNRVRIGMRSFLEEVRRKPLAEMSASMTDVATGVTYTSTTEPVGNLTTTAGANMQDVYDLKVTASYSIGNEVREETVDVYVYKPAQP
jgi:Tfp pilus assembly protein PilV